MFITNRLKLLGLAFFICGAFVTLLIVLDKNKYHTPVEYFLENTMADYERDWPTEVLNVFEEPTFIPRPKGGSEKFRFLMMHSLYHHPVIIRIERSSNGASKIYAKDGWYALGWVDELVSGPQVRNARTYERKLSNEEYSYFNDMFVSLNICKSDTEKGRGGGLDGSNWLFEYRNSEVHCQLYVWSPEDETKHSAAELMFSLAGIPIDEIGPFY